MKKILVTLLLLLSAAHAKTLPDVTKVVLVSDLTVEMITELTQGMHPDTAVEFKEGSCLPVHFLFRNKLFSVAYDPKITVKMETAGYVRFMKKKAYMSLDLVNWDKPEYFLDADILNVNVETNEDKTHVTFEASAAKSGEQ